MCELFVLFLEFPDNIGDSNERAQTIESPTRGPLIAVGWLEAALDHYPSVQVHLYIFFTVVATRSMVYIRKPPQGTGGQLPCSWAHPPNARDNKCCQF